MYGVGVTGLCFKTVIYTEISVFSQNDTSCSDGLDPHGSMELGTLASPKQEMFT